MGKLINIDNGGTLTDVWVLDGDKSYHTKTITTPYDLSRCFHEALKKVSAVIYGEEDLEGLLHSTDHIRYSTTQGTNALVEKKGPRPGLILDAEFPLVKLQRTDKEAEMFASIVGDRVESIDTGASGDAYEKRVAEAVNRLCSDGANRIVIALGGNDYLYREAQFRKVSLSLFPRHLLGAVPVLYAGNISSDQSLPRRAWTAILNAYLHPAMERFLYNAENKLRDFRVQNPLLIYRNDGYAGRVAKTVALKTYSSGPRAGMDSARAYARYYGFDRFLTLDVGGTTTDIGMIENGVVRSLDRGEVEGIECSFPLSDIVSIGVGGGSIFRVSEGVVRVGPDSVGGAPGPACFGMGGKEATITDALLLMGLLDPKTYFGGNMRLDSERSRKVIAERVAGPLGVTVEQAAHEMLKAWAQVIADGLVTYLGHHAGKSAENATLSAFGGGGPMAVLSVAEAAGIDTVIVPRLSAVFSAHGIGFSDIAHTSEIKLSSNDTSCLQKTIDTLRHRVGRDMFSEGFQLEDCELQAWMRVNGEQRVIDPDAPTLADKLDSDSEIFVGVRAVKAVNRAELPARTKPGLRNLRVDTTRQLIGADGSTQRLPVVNVEDQIPGASGCGPAVIEESFWTCKVEAGWHFEFTTNGDVLFQKA